jgi:DNA-binding transcriptional LysR family regulator
VNVAGGGGEFFFDFVAVADNFAIDEDRFRIYEAAKSKAEVKRQKSKVIRRNSHGILAAAIWFFAGLDWGMSRDLAPDRIVAPPAMELSQLRAILGLQNLASLSRAGEQLHLSPSAVFCQIRQLEDELGQKLYERAGKTLHLTGAGELLAQHARKILSAHDTAVTEVTEQGSRHRGLLRIGCGPHGSVRIAPFLLRSFANRYPDSELRLVSADDQSLLRDVRTGLLDAILMTLPIHDKQLTEEPLWSFELVFVLPPSSRLDGRRTDLQSLKNLPFILYRRAGVTDPGVREMFVPLEFVPNVVMENDEVDSIKEMVSLGLGITLLPLHSVDDEVKRRRLRIVRPPRKQLYNYGLVYRSVEYRPLVLTHLQEVARRWREWWPHAAHVSPPIP